MHKIIFLILILTLLEVPAFGEFEDIDINANGYNWISWSMSDKEIFMTLLYQQLGRNRQFYAEEKVIKKVDDYYSLAKYKTKGEQNKYLKVPVAVLVGYLTGCKIEIINNVNAKKIKGSL